MLKILVKTVVFKLQSITLLVTRRVTQTRIADIDNRFCREIEKSFCAGKVYPNTLHLGNTRPQ